MWYYALKNIALGAKTTHRLEASMHGFNFKLVGRTLHNACNFLPCNFLYYNEFYLSLYAHLYEEIIFQKLNYIEK
jgi:hypothetical protein